MVWDDDRNRFSFHVVRADWRPKDVSEIPPLRPAVQLRDALFQLGSNAQAADLARASSCRRPGCSQLPAAAPRHRGEVTVGCDRYACPFFGYAIYVAAPVANRCSQQQLSQP